MKKTDIMEKKPAILIVEDELLTAENIKMTLIKLGYNVIGIATNATKAIELVKEKNPDIILMDIMLKGTINGIEATKRINEFADIPVIFLTAYSDDDTINKAKLTTPYGYIVKPFENRDLKTNIEMTIYRHSMERKVKENEENLSITLNSIGDGVIATDDTGCITRMNPVAEKMCGWKFDDAKGKKLDDVFVIISAATRLPIDNPVNEVLSSGESVKLANHTLLISKDGTERHISDSASPIMNKNGIIKGVVLVFSDVTESYKAREAIKRSENKFRTLVDQAAEMLFLHDMEGNIVDVNHAAIETTGYSRKELLKMKVFDIDPDADLRKDKKNIWEDTPIGAKIFFEAKHRRKEGSIYDAEIRAAKVMLEDGEFIVALANDISERKEAERKQREWESLMEYIIYHDPSAIAVLDKNLKFKFVSKRFLKDYKVVEKQIIGKHHYDVFPDIPQNWKEVHRKALSGEILGKEEDLFERKDGSVDWTRWECRPWYFEDGSIGGIVLYTEVITEQKESQLELQRRENKLNSIFKVAPVGIGVVANRKFIEVNETLCSMLFYSREELIGKDSRMLYSTQEEYDFVGKEKYRQIAEKGTGSVETRLICKNGKIINIMLSSTPIDMTDLSKGVTFTALDITERKIYENELFKWSEIFKASQTGIVMGDPDSKNLGLMNPAFAQMHGYSVDELMGKPIRSVFAPSEYDHIPQMIQKAHENGHHICESLHIKKDGTIFPVLISLTAIKNDAGEILYRIVNVLDYTEKKLAEEELNKYRNHLEELVEERTKQISKHNIFLRTFIDTIPVPVFIKDNEGYYTDINPAYEKIFKFKRKDVIGKKEEDLFSTSTAEALNNNDKLLYEKLFSVSYEFVYEKDNNLSVQSLVYKASFGHSDSKPEGIAGIIINISERKKLEEQIVIAYEKEKELSELKSSFISMASHEFRTPLTSILSSSELIEMYFQDTSDERIKKNLKRIQDSVDNMTELLDDVLLISKGEKGKLQFIPLNMNLKILCDNLIEETEHIASRNHKICCNYNLENEFVNADEKLLKLILNNLLSNAVKYSPEGGEITLDVYLNEDIIQFTVTDEGIGISENEIGKIFEPFHRASNAYKIRGTGLGLNIVRLAAELHGGFINVKSEIDKGTEIKVSVKNNLN